MNIDFEKLDALEIPETHDINIGEIAQFIEEIKKDNNSKDAVLMAILRAYKLGYVVGNTNAKKAAEKAPARI